ncbi:hypothetical protein [Actinoplanes sp. NPDC049599]|uniref:hypothetical protein n=1 Tax=Actinoplanes sp. NPDC049599 TaxID=3363903 RepID=UPI0037B393A8
MDPAGGTTVDVRDEILAEVMGEIGEAAPRRPLRTMAGTAVALAGTSLVTVQAPCASGQFETTTYA